MVIIILFFSDVEEGEVVFGLLGIYQILFIILAVLTIFFVLKIYNNGRISLKTTVLWVCLWIMLFVISLSPDSTTFLANRLGIGRGLDLLIIIGILGTYYLIFRLYLKIENINQNINKLVTEIAIHNENHDNEK
ncbi:MAG: DUF2304 family protein [Methanobrevibacter sp.]|jgi:hypothetical protein|nr:DUF2304 family protein [Candidatus Methanovirga procula]